MKAEFLFSVANISQLPPESLPEIAFAGRSNVGKSSLINKILDRKSLVKTGKTPGKTRLLNFFNIDDKMLFVDLPGYGYAKVSKQEKKDWGVIIEDYFINRKTLAMCVLLVDIRRSLGEEEKSLLKLLDFYGINKCLVLTKSDKFSKNQLLNNKIRHSKEMGIDINTLIHFSAVTGEGKSEIRKAIASAANIEWQ